MTSFISDRPDALVEQDGAPDPERRMLLTGLTAAYLSSFVPVANAQAVESGGEAFLSVSQYLTGRASLDVEQSARLYEALAAAPQFEAGVQALLALIRGRQIDPGQLQQLLDAEGSPISGLPRAILTAWYTGIVSGRCVTFETSLMHVVVADRLNPPSYCAGPYGSWAHEPGKEG